MQACLVKIILIAQNIKQKYIIVLCKTGYEKEWALMSFNEL